jgi:uracil permease
MSSGTIVPANVVIALVTLGAVVLGSLVFRGFLAAIPVLIGVVAGYACAIVINFSIPGTVNFTPLSGASLLVLPKMSLPVFDLASILVVMPAALVVISEHVGHLFVTGNIVGRDLFEKPGLPRSLFSDGISTILSGFAGACPTTTYGENMGVMAITKVYSVWVIGGAAVISIIMAFLGHVSGLLYTLPTPVVGGISLVLFGVIAASGFRILVETKVDFSKSRNLILSALVLMVGISGITVKLGQTELKGMVLATLVGMLLGLGVWLLDRLGLAAEKADGNDL